MKKLLLVLAAVLALAVVPAATAKPVTATGTLTIAPYQTSGSVTEATWAGVPASAKVELSVGCEDYFGTFLAPTGSPWTLVIPTPPGEVCAATLYYYVWHGNHEGPVVVLASAQD